MSDTDSMVLKMAVSDVIAGHTFVLDTRGGRVCSECGKQWTAICGATEADVGKDGFAHFGVLSRYEWEQIRSENERIWRHVADVAVSPGSPVSAPEPDPADDPMFAEITI